MEAWIDHPNVTAVIMAGFPGKLRVGLTISSNDSIRLSIGQEAGNSIVDVLYGYYNPSGRLPYTIPKGLEEWPVQIEFINTDLDPQPQVDYNEGVYGIAAQLWINAYPCSIGIYLDYRYYQQNNLTPRYGFGYGLSYTSFNYTNFQTRQLSDQNNERRWNSGEAYTAANATNQVGSSLSRVRHSGLMVAS
jgi:beta-glucosidase